MDTSKTYIKMCKMAEEIQKLNVCFYIDTENYNPRIKLEQDIKIGSAPYLKYDIWWESNTMWESPKHVWLPRQDQLQEMIEWESKYKLKFDFSKGMYWLRVLDRAAFMLYELSGASMEQLWLSFVMKEKYNKIWTGTEWINENL